MNMTPAVKAVADEFGIPPREAARVHEIIQEKVAKLLNEIE
jgi:hypothetical protein